ncbi:MAG TPA: SURF1 family protein [Aeromicrobium sp.]|nr:SURF1 family protein [Aeromicrobium sp.]
MLNRRTIALTIGAFTLAALCVRLGFWQWHRMEHREHQQALIERHLGGKPVPILSVVQRKHPVTEDQEWTRVTATGRFDARREVTVKFTTREGRPGADVVTPLVLADGSAILVDRGWMATENTDARPSDVPRPPAGPVTIEGWLRPDNEAGDNAVVPVAGQVRAIASHGLRSYVGRDLLPGFVNVQQPRTPGLAPEPRPHVSHALNFFYALQWWFFAGLALIGPFWFNRDPQAKATRSA